MKPKKPLFCVLSIMLAMVFLIPVTAFAENGPAKESFSDISLYNKDEAYSIYSEADSVEGVAYDETTNTLTLTDYKRPELILSCFSMGDDFKLCLVGDNELRNIAMWAAGWGGCLTITGTGSLIVNEKKEHPYAINIYAEVSTGKLNIQDGVTVWLYSQDKVSQVVAIYSSTVSDKNSAIVIGGNVAENYTISCSEEDIPIYKSVFAYNAASGEDNGNVDEQDGVIDGYHKVYSYSIDAKTLTITPSDAKYGDCNNDNGINAKDVLILKQHLAKWTVDINMTNADCNGDSAVNAKDLLRLRQYLANWGVPLGRA